MSSQSSLPNKPELPQGSDALQLGPITSVEGAQGNGNGEGQAQAQVQASQPPAQAQSTTEASQPPAQAKPAGKKRIGDILIDMGAITEGKLTQALSEAKATKVPVGAVLIKLGFVDDTTLGKALAVLHGFEYFDLTSVELDPQVIKLLPEDFIKRHMIIPVRVDMRYKRLEVVMARPDNLRVLDEIALLTGFRPIPRVSTHKQLVGVLDKYFRHNVSGDDALRQIEEDLRKDDSVYDDGSLTAELEAEMAAEDAPVVMLVNSVLMEAIDLDASDIHWEPQKERLLIRYRIDGILKEAKSIPKKMSNAVISRVKVASGMDIAERRRPQDGRMKIKMGSQEVDMRVNTLPLQFGEKICVRILKATATSGGLETLGLTSEERKKITRMIKAPNGIILVTGPTGSGKTTTLYTCLREINNPKINISTVEDPIEYPLAGVNQTPINAKAGMTFSNALRALLRQDPDVILVGEVRDEETLEAAIHAALTGHLVFSTIHTNSAAKTVTRLLEMGAPAYLVSSAVIGILAQRLVRRICSKCKESYAATEEEITILGLKSEPDKDITLYRGKGCETCEDSGYSGRVGLYEIMRVSREISKLVDAGASTFAIEDLAVKEGMYTLAMDGKRKVMAGFTTVEEITRVLGMDLEN